MVTILMLIAGLSLILAGVASVVAWRAVRDSRRSSETRIARLSHELDGVGTPLQQEVNAAGSGMFSQVQSGGASSRAPLAVAAGSLIVVVALVFAGVATRGSAASSDSNDPPARDPSHAMIPLELVALGHERQAGMLTIRGVVKNPTNGHEMKALTAHVLLLDSNARVLNRAQGAVRVESLRPDDQTTFHVTMPDIPRVARYRVSFDTSEGAVSHVDRRDDR